MTELTQQQQDHLRLCLTSWDRTEWFAVEAKDEKNIKEAIPQARRERIRPREDGVTLERMGILKGILRVEFIAHMSW